MGSVLDQGKKLVIQALRFADDAYEYATKEAPDANLAIRKAQEALECVAKGAIALLGERPRHGHGLEFVAQLREVLEIEANRFPGRGPIIAAHYQDSANFIGIGHDATGMTSAIKRYRGALTMLSGPDQIWNPQNGPLLDVSLDGSTMAVYADGKVRLAVTDTTFGGVRPTKKFLPVEMPQDEFLRISRACRQLASRRNPAFYREVDYSQQDANESLAGMTRGISIVRSALGI